MQSAPATVVLLGTAFIAFAQQNAPTGILRGNLVELTGTQRSGELTFRLTGDQLYFCSYDDKTYFERDNARIPVTSAQKGDRIEVLSDRKPGSQTCYIRTLQILDATPKAIVPGHRPKPAVAPSANPYEVFGPRGNLTFSGVVIALDPERVVLRTRAGDHKRILLRSDTRFLTGGQSADRSDLPVNVPVFIRAGRNLEGEIEAYQVIWGDILLPN